MLSASTLLLLGSMLCALRLDQPGSFPKPLSAKEERVYLERAAAGDREARNVLIERNLRLVAHIMKKYYAQSADQEDLLSIGTIGLIKGIESFDPSKGARLATYAARCVENAILSSMRLCEAGGSACQKSPRSGEKKGSGIKDQGSGEVNCTHENGHGDIRGAPGL